jgi:hypothetical protein
MLNYYSYYKIADDVLAKIGLPDTSEMTDELAQEFNDKYLKDDSIIDSLVRDEVAKYDTSDNVPSDVEDIINNASDEVFFKIDDTITEFEQMSSDEVYSKLVTAYEGIVNAIKNADIPGVAKIDTEFQPADPDVGIFDEERGISITLDNGSNISLIVEFYDK